MPGCVQRGNFDVHGPALDDNPPVGIPDSVREPDRRRGDHRRTPVRFTHQQVQVQTPWIRVDSLISHSELELVALPIALAFATNVKRKTLARSPGRSRNRLTNCGTRKPRGIPPLAVCSSDLSDPELGATDRTAAVAETMRRRLIE
jgi:hypothetical protein